MPAKYRTVTKEQFLFYETRTVASFVDRGLDRETLIAEIKNENLFQYPTERMVTTMARICLRRVDALGSQTLVRLLADAPIDLAKQINLYAIMRDNQLVRDFMTDVVGEKYRTGDLTFERRDVNLFFFTLREQIDSIATWSDRTIDRTKQVLARILVECGYLDSPKSTALNCVAIEPELENEIRSAGDLSALGAFNCFI